MNEASLERVRVGFNERQDAVRVISLLSPTCLVCQYGQGVVRTVFDVASEAELWGLIGWIPMMDADSEAAGELEAQRFADARVHHVWDGQRALGSAFAKTLALEGPAWDVYLLYGRGVTWTDTIPPPPTFWMHQLPSRAKANPMEYTLAARLTRRPGHLTQRIQPLRKVWAIFS